MADSLTVGYLRAILAMDSAQYEAGARQAKMTSDSLTKTFKDMAAGMSAAGKAATDSAKLIAGMGDSGRAAAAAIAQATKPLDSLAAGMSAAGKAASDSGRLITGMGDAGRAAAAATAAAAADAQKAAQRFQVLSDDLASVGRQATDIGRGFTTAFTVPIVAGLTASATAAIQFESSFAGVKKTVDATDAEFAEMAEQMRALAREIPVNVNELNRLAESAGAMGIPKEEIIDFTRVMALLGVTTNLTSEQAAESIGKIQNIFSSAGVDTDRFGATLVALGNAGASTEQEIVKMAARIAGAGQQVGLTQAQVLSFASALASVGIEAEAGGSAISRIFLKMNDAVMSGGESMAEFARVAGVTSAQFKEAFERDASEAMVLFINGLARLKGEGENTNATMEGMIGKNIILKDTLNRLTGAGQLLSDQLALGNRAWEENSALTEEARKRFETTEAQLTLLWNRVKDVAITFGNALLPMIKEVVAALSAMTPYLEDAAQFFAGLPMPIQMTAVGLAGLLAAAGPVLYVLGQLALSASAIAAAFTETGIATRTLTPLISGIRTVIGGITSSVGPAAAGILRVAGAFGSWEAAIGLASRALAAIPGWGWLAAGAATLATVLWQVAGGWDGIRSALAPVGQFLSDVGEVIRDVATIALYLAKDALSAVVSTFLDAARAVGSFAATIGSEFIGLLRTVGTLLLAAAQAAVEFHRDVIMAFADPLIKLAEWSGALDLVRRGLAAAGEWWNDFIAGAKLAIQWADRVADAIRDPFGGVTLPPSPFPSGSPQPVNTMSLSEAIRLTEEMQAAGVRSAAGVARLTEEAKKAAEEVKKLRDELTGAADIAEARKMALALVGTDLSTFSREARDRIHEVFEDAIDVLQRNKQAIPAEFKAIFDASLNAIEAPLTQISRTIQTAIDADAFTAEATAATNVLLGFTREGLIPATSSTGELSRALMFANPVLNEHALNADYAANNIGELTLRQLDFLDTLDRLSGILGQVGGSLGGWAGTIVSGVGDIVGAFSQLERANPGQTMQNLSSAITATVTGGIYGYFVQGLIDYYAGPPQEALNQAAEMLEEWTDDLSRQFRETASEMDRLAAGSDRFAQVTGLLSNVLEDFGFTGNQVNAMLTEYEGSIARAAARGPEEMQRALDRINDVIERHKQIMADWDAGLNEFLAGFAQRVGGLVESLSDVTVATEDTQAAFDRMGQFAVIAFSSVLERTGSAYEALMAIQEPLNELIALQERLGLTGSATFERLADISGIVSANADLFASIEGLQRMMEGLDRATLLTQDDFRLFAQDATSLFNELVGRGVDANTAMALMQPTLQMLWELQQRFGIEIDAATQALLDQAEAAGIVGEAHRSVNERILEALLEIEAAINRLPQALANAAAQAEILNDVLRGHPRTPDDPITGNAVPRPQTIMHDGGIVEYAHAGKMVGQMPNLFSDERLMVLQTGEGILNRRAMSVLGESWLNAVNADPWGGAAMASQAMSSPYLPMDGDYRVSQIDNSSQSGDVYVTVNVSGQADASTIKQAALDGVLDGLERGGWAATRYRRIHQQLVPR